MFSGWFKSPRPLDSCNGIFQKSVFTETTRTAGREDCAGFLLIEVLRRRISFEAEKDTRYDLIRANAEIGRAAPGSAKSTDDARKMQTVGCRKRRVIVSVVIYNKYQPQRGGQRPRRTIHAGLVRIRVLSPLSGHRRITKFDAGRRHSTSPSKCHDVLQTSQKQRA
jgi:hypothetical protein